MNFYQEHKVSIWTTALCVLIAGCSLFPVKTQSPVDGRKVTRDELRADLNAVKAKFETAEQDLKRKEEIRATLATVGLNLANSYLPGATDLLSLVFAGTTVGAWTDRVRRGRASKPRTVEK